MSIRGTLIAIDVEYMGRDIGNLFPWLSFLCAAGNKSSLLLMIWEGHAQVANIASMVERIHIEGITPASMLCWTISNL